MNIVVENWEQILNKMKDEYCSSNISYNTWIAPLTVYEVTDDTVYILVKLKASLEHIEDVYKRQDQYFIYCLLFIFYISIVDGMAFRFQKPVLPFIYPVYDLKCFRTADTYNPNA